MSPDLDRALSLVAKRDQVPEATKAAELLRLGMELEEDNVLERLASERYKTSRKRLSHKQVWGS